MISSAGRIDLDVEGGLALPRLLARGVAAYRRLHYYLALLDEARAHARGSPATPRDLRAERTASGVTDPALDAVVEGSACRGPETIYIPRVSLVLKALFVDLAAMLDPVCVAARGNADLAERCDVYRRRLQDLAARVPSSRNDELTAHALASLTRRTGNGHDTVHQLVTDLQSELERLKAAVSIDILDGAAVHSLSDGDRPLVQAFMEGLHRTAHLKGDRGGLDTTAAREGDRVAIHVAQAHPVLIYIDGLSVDVLFADLHQPRTRFLQDLLQPYAMRWSASADSAGTDDERAVGRFVAETREQLTAYLTFLGSRLVFLIDWSRARKRLARLVGKADAFALLKRAADENVGHCGFLQAGDVQLVETILVRAAPLQLGPGARLDECLGRAAAHAFVMSVLRTTSAGMAAGHSIGLIEDEILAELLRHMETGERHALAAAAEQAAMIVASAAAMHRALQDLAAGSDQRDAARAADLARSWTAKANRIARDEGRRLTHRSEGEPLRPLLSEGDAAADALAESAFLMTLVPLPVDPAALTRVTEVIGLVEAAAREYQQCLHESGDLSRTSASEDMDAFFVSIERLGDLGSRAASAMRTATEEMIRTATHFQQLHVLTAIAGGFERAARALTRCGPIVRDHVLSARLSR